MKILQTKVRQCAIIFLALAILNLFNGCKTYRMIGNDIIYETTIDRLIAEERYFILYSSNQVFHLTNIQRINETITGELMPVDPYHIPYLPIGEDYSPVLTLKSRAGNVDNEVLLFTNLEIPQDSKSVVLPLSEIQKIKSYKWRLTEGSALGIACATIFGILIVVGIIILMNGEMDYSGAHKI